MPNRLLLAYPHRHKIQFYADSFSQNISIERVAMKEKMNELRKTQFFQSEVFTRRRQDKPGNFS